MHDSNQSLRFSRSYLEATGKPLHSRDFYVPEPMVTKKEAVFWVFAVIVLISTVYILKGF
jgi:hypothetical protein